ncbi:MAG TPA: alpha/beta hydrolase [Gemmataceae bacterium]|nr:alpha/beta hydrolase [Gemmataceae bacterium]
MSKIPRWRRNLYRVAGYSCVGYLVIAVSAMFFENYLVYFPTKASSYWDEAPQLPKRDLNFISADGTKIHAWWCPRDGAPGALLYCHGNGGNLSMRAEWFRDLQEGLNVSVLAIDYPGYGKSDGRPSEQGCYAAAEAAFDWLTNEAHIPPEQIVLFGESLGGGVATEIATRRPCRALVLYCSFLSVPEVGQHHYRFLPVRRFMRNRFDNDSKIPGLKIPVFIAHGDADGVIPPSHAMQLFAIANGPKAIYWEAGAGHVMDPSPAFLAALRDFLEKHAPVAPK